VLDEVSLVVFEFRPILRVLRKVDFVNCPEGSHLVLVHLPNVWILNREDNEPIGVLFEEWLWESNFRLAYFNLLFFLW